MDSDLQEDRCRRLRDEFARWICEPADFWIYQGGSWHHGVSAEAANTAQLGDSISPEALPQSPRSLRLPVVRQAGDGLFLIGSELRVSPTDEQTPAPVVWAAVRTDAAALMEKVLQLSSRSQRLESEVAELRCGCEPLLEQISANFEELAWLRQLCAHSDACDASEPVSALAGRILPNLRPLIKAEAVALIHVNPTETTACPQPAEAPSPALWVGPRLLEDAALCDLIQSLRADSPSKPLIVRNRSTDDSCLSHFPQLRSCILAPIIRGKLTYGWLMALNRVPWTARSSRPAQSVPTTCSDDDFGTGDASLVASAAVTLAAHARNVDLLRQKEVMLIGTIRTLINAIDARDSYTCGHSERVAYLARGIAQELGMSAQEAERIYIAGLLHDIGKIGIPDYVLLKPGKLTDEEFAIVKRHPVIGHSILKHVSQFKPVLPGVLHHHESYDGRGYPEGLAGDAIPLDGRILAVADAYDAMTSARPYRAGMPIERAEAILMGGAGKQWDTVIVEAFLKARPGIQDVSQLPRQPVINVPAEDQLGATWHDKEVDLARHELAAAAP